ncbi:hypothetical protein LWI28_025646 [Acer negundo]|uniref:Uncharacterized protein n=1 Tax=Acer negundo TaxID=4023 RepID=A0AAD5IGF3_ACENE|nr:hypothetical protein LWI28_025646 [Acer negundo]
MIFIGVMSFQDQIRERENTISISIQTKEGAKLGSWKQKQSLQFRQNLNLVKKKLFLLLLHHHRSTLPKVILCLTCLLFFTNFLSKEGYQSIIKGNHSHLLHCQR